MNCYRDTLQLIDAQRPFALATVIKASGSTPQKAGAKALFEPGGAIWGTLGGGCLEAEARVRGLRALDEKVPRVFDLSLDDDYGWDDGLICGGQVRIFIDPDARKNRAAYAAAHDAAEARKRGVLVTVIAEPGAISGEARWIPEGDLARETRYPGGHALQDCLQRGLTGHFRASPETEAVAEPILPAPQLLIAGGGHVGQATAHLAVLLGFEVTVIEDRPAFTDPRLFPSEVKTICGEIAAEVEAFPTGPDTYIVIVTRGHRNDAAVLKACINSTAAYIGMIGSKRKILVMRKGFLEEGIATEERFARVHSPIGLDIGALTVYEIATSIAAQLVAARRNRLDACVSLADAVRA